MDDRVNRAVELFKSGYNCSQSVVAAFADLYNMDEELALRVSASFGGGIGRMRETCGAVCGMFILAGLENGTTVAKNPQGKANNYKLVQHLAEMFKERNGSIVCRELLQQRKDTPIVATPDERNDAYYQKRPCLKLVEDAACIWTKYLEEK